MKRVLIIGCGGAGKSTLARQLGEQLQIDVVHLDAAYWKPGWIEPNKAEWDATIQTLLQQERWIMDGNYSRTLDVRIPACDTIIFLDISRFVCLWSVIKRRFRYHNARRPDMAQGCNEQVDWVFLRWIWNYPRESRQRVVRLLEQYRDQKKLVWLRSRADIKDFLAHLKITE